MWVRPSVLILICAATLGAQDLIGDYPGRPPEAPLLGFLGRGGRRAVTDSSVPPRGAVSRVLWEEYQVQIGLKPVTPTVRESVTTKFDGEGREVRRIEGTLSQGRTTATQYQNGHVISEVTSFMQDRKSTGPQAWSYWTYDATGHLVDFRRGAGDEIQNHYTSFKYDPQGRLTALEYHQGADDALWSRSEYKYSDGGKAMEESVYKDNDRFHWGRLTFDDQGHVLHEETRDKDPEGTECRIDLSFGYDAKGRVIEQVTKLDAVSESKSVMLPGKITIAYDDTKHIEQISYSDGKEIGMFLIWLDEHGAVLGSSGSLNGEPDTKNMLECNYDSHGNWTECRKWHMENGRREMNGLWRRTITYR